MTSWRDTLLPVGATILDAVQSLHRTGAQICLVADDGERLLGTVTDGDIRRGILKAVPLDAVVSTVMNREPLVGSPADAPGQLLDLMKLTHLHQIPIVDAALRIVDLKSWNDLLQSERIRDNWVILMAGGRGHRLMPMTEHQPKPLLTVGQKPLLESILEGLLSFGFRSFFISVNYKAEMVKTHFGDGRRWNCEVRYLEEETHLGTAGALSLLPERPTQPIIVMNGDVLTKVNFENLLKFHQEQGAVATMCVREYETKIPFGVVELENNRIRSIVEKPTSRSFVNAGIYVLDPSVLDAVPAGEKFDMTDLFGRLIAAGRPAAAFPIWEYWIDVGRIDDFERANIDYPHLFAR